MTAIERSHFSISLSCGWQVVWAKYGECDRLIRVKKQNLSWLNLSCCHIEL
ncbi:MAG: hypothetical protein F6K28_34430 [Microcoleus sp. SIO2G3]|nr:hypothetical protein [Microcoleus sp. SIO2G3]